MRFIQIWMLCLFFCAANALAEENIQSDGINYSQKINIRLTPNEQAWLKKTKKVTVAVKDGWMPIEFDLEGNHHQGLSIDYLNRLEKLLNINFTLVNYTENIQPGQADIISAVSNYNLKNPDYHLIPQPFLTFPYAIYTHKNIGSNKKITSLEDLNNLNVAIFKNGPVIQEIHKNYPKIKLVYVDIADEAFEKLKAGAVVAYIGNEMIVDYNIIVNRLDFVEKSAFTPFTSTVSMAVRKDLPELASILDKGLIALGQNNKDIIDKWKITDRADNPITTLLLSSLLIIFSFVLFRFYRLKQKIKKQKAETQKQIWYQANYDHLTKLPNRYLLQNRLQQSIKKADRSKLLIGILFIDLDNFKKVNDKSGHSIGDKLLIEAAERIGNCVRTVDTTARFGGDEFIVILNDMKELSSLESTCQSILNKLEQPFSIDNDEYYVTASIGITTYPNDGHQAEALLSYADQAMFEAKKLGRNRFQFFTQSIQAALLNKLAITGDIREAFLQKQFVLYYQPIVDLKNPTIIKAEALVRWNHPVRGVINPVEFIPLMEETGLISELGNWVFSQALRDLALIKENSNAEFQLSINVSPYQFNKPADLLKWAETIKELGIPQHSLTIEITEGLLLEPSNAVINTISTLKKVGVEFSIDDFGTGYSALAYLKKFDIDYVKIDRSFIHNLEPLNYDAVLCEAIIEMAHKLGIKIIAEGIETVLQKELLTQFECDYGQGFLFAEPEPLSELLKRLKPELILLVRGMASH
ncbi:MAG TPA: EAL domain-containing protein [Methylotenera sp.]|nr:EAL domain-containing protein [Methylotenera sp.]